MSRVLVVQRPSTMTLVWTDIWKGLGMDFDGVHEIHKALQD